MNKKRLPLLIISLFLGGLSTAALADIDPQVCRELVNAANSSQTIPDSILNAYGQDVAPCLSACSNLYGNGVDPGTLSSIAVCRKTLSSLAFENNSHAATLTLQSQISPQTTPAQTIQTAQTNLQLPQANSNVAVNTTNTDTNADSNTNSSANADNNNSTSADNSSTDDSQSASNNDNSNQQTIHWF